MDPPIAKPHNIKSKLLNKTSESKMVTIMAIAIPKIPKKFPCRDVSGDDNPLRANMKSTPETKYKDAAKFVDII